MNRSSILFGRHPRRAPKPRQGFALMMALGALVIIAVLIAGSSYVGLQESRLGQNQLVQSRAAATAEYGLNKIQADWDKTPNLQMANGASFDMSYTLTGQGVADVRITRLNNETFWLVSTGRATIGNAGQARTAVKRVGAILRLRIPSIKADAAFTTAGDVKTSGNPKVIGTNTIPPGWSGCASSGSPDTLSKPGIVAPPDQTVTIGNTKHVVGSPTAVVRDELAGKAETYVQYGDENWEALKSQAIDITGINPGSIGPVALAGYCDKSNKANWGEPWRTSGYVQECINYFPILYSKGNLHINANGRGQGILLVEGDFKVNGTFDFYGLVIVSGKVEAGNGTASIYGGIMAASASLTTDSLSTFSGTVDINYSQCGLERAMRGSAQVTQARERAWAELY